MSSVRRALGTAVILAGFSLFGPASVAFALAEAPAVADLNCKRDFKYQEDAQAVLDQDRSDPHNLDDDDDGIACETLPKRGTAPTKTIKPGLPPVVTETKPAQFDDKDCADFPSQAAAQAELKKNPRDPHKLDGDHDGYACESRFGEPKKSGQVKVKPVGGVATGGGETAEPNGGLLEIGAVALTGAALLTATAAGASLVLRRRADR
ncbi:excalibur calcium-binding domain-containing protein [Amycolatopsis umgeniensis]|uniref:Excalibur calcium-binding domain-containing protein n=1 Tax=Amycolatopsis umgeniensis TaxID=336628 RepID=A0A841B5Z4_9PSEU|nr:excalibur calcium-binding domain-containing protein [Amycolatopsis umgeniensis]MBB5854280.1 hypothetical protein [Amycolatopsis umgeniensis]